MTTIAADGNIIAADGMMLGNWIVTGYQEPKLRVIKRDGYPVIIGLAGLAGMFDPLVEWIKRGAPFDDCPKSNSPDPNPWTLVLIDRGGVSYIDAMAPSIMPVREMPIAFGAGREVAIGAMDAGADPVRAVQIAAKRSLGTGGRVLVINIEQALSQGAIVAHGATGTGTLQ